MMRRLAIILISLVVLVLVFGLCGCSESHTSDYWQEEAIAAVQAYLFSLAKGQTANEYVNTEINGACWAANYDAVNESWDVYTYDYCPGTSSRLSQNPTPQS